MLSSPAQIPNALPCCQDNTRRLDCVVSGSDGSPGSPLGGYLSPPLLSRSGGVAEGPGDVPVTSCQSASVIAAQDTSLAAAAAALSLNSRKGRSSICALLAAEQQQEH